MKPEEIKYKTDIVKLYAESLNSVHDPVSFTDFLDEWNWCLDEQTQKLSGDDWVWMASRINYCRKKEFTLRDVPEDCYFAACLVFPILLVKIAMLSLECNYLQGAFFIEMKTRGVIDENYRWIGRGI